MKVRRSNRLRLTGLLVVVLLLSVGCGDSGEASHDARRVPAGETITMQNGLSLVVPTGNVAYVRTFPGTDDASPVRETVDVGKTSGQEASFALYSMTSLPRSGPGLIRVDAPEVLAASEDGTVTVLWERTSNSARVEVALDGKLCGMLELPVDDTANASYVLERVQRAWKALSIQGTSLPEGV